MSDPYIGQISSFAFNFAPAQWAFCNGSIQTISNQQALFALIGNIYGGDGRLTFGLPSLTSRSTIGSNMGAAPGLQQFFMGQSFGFQFQSLDVRHLPEHAHTASFHPTSGDGTAVKVEATTDGGDNATPTPGAYLAQPAEESGPDTREHMYKTNPSAGSLVSLGGVSGGGGSSSGIVTIDPSGQSQQFSIINPFVAINFSMALLGLFPPRN